MTATGRRVLLAAAVALAARPARAAGVDLGLVLAVDASYSVTPERFELQKQGYAAAWRDPRVIEAVQSGANQRVAVCMFQWTGPALHELVVDWTEVADVPSAEALAARIAAAPRKLFSGGTSLSGAIDFGMQRLASLGRPATRRTIDISGDGSNNRGRPAAEARDDAVAAGVTINGLPILTIEPGLDAFYRTEVIGGPGAFLIAIDSYDRFAEAIRRKLVSEIAGLPLSLG